MPTFAAVDIGSNSVRLKIARLEKHRLKVLHEDREVTRLGESVFQTGILNPEAMERTVKVLRRFHKAMQVFGADVPRVVATSAIRDAHNANAFTHWVTASTGWRVEIISGLEEGRLIHFGVMSNVNVRADRVLLIDLGGGSCELTVSHRGEIESMYSLPLGAVRLTRDFLAQDPPKKNQVQSLRAFIEEEVGRVRESLMAHPVHQILATSGTPAALAAMWAARYRRATATVPREALLKFTTELTILNVQQRRSVEGIGLRRAEIIIAGAWVFSELLVNFRLPNFRYVPFGLRDGILAQLAADYDEAAGGKLQKQLSSQREKALFSLASHYQVDLRFAERVKKNCNDLFRGLAKVHNLPAEYGEFLDAAAMLQEVGSFVNRAGRRRHAYYLVANSELLGWDQRERRIIAGIVRYIGGSRLSPDSAPIRVLSPADRLCLPKAVMILRLARAMELGRRGAVTGCKVSMRRGRVVLQLKAKPQGAELELWAVEKERAYFREVFGRELDCLVG